MKRLCILMLGVVVLLAPAGWAEEPGEGPSSPGGFFSQPTLTNNWFGLGDTLNEAGLEVELSTTQIYQANVWGRNTETNKKDQRYSMSANLELEADLEQLISLPGGSFYAGAEGSWHDGIDGDSIGSTFGVNGDAGGDRSFDVVEVYYSQVLADGRVFFKIGKLDVGGGYECRSCSGAFDGNAYAEDETSQFLNGALTGNPTVASPDEGLGAVVQVHPVEWMYVAAGIADADADRRETGFNTAFDSDCNYYIAVETGFVPVLGGLPGAYRVGGWHTNSDFTQFNGRTDNENYGLYVSCDQALFRENDEDGQGLGVFVRYGVTDDDVFEMDQFWSFGAQYAGLIPGRDADVLGIGFASGEASENAAMARSAERVVEAYYNINITDFLQIAPDIQYIHNPGWSNGDALVAGLRAQIAF